jgi:predicted DNA-binding protein
MNRDEALRALHDTDWSGAEVVREPRPVMVVHSARIPGELSERLEAEATRRGITPSALIRTLVEEGLRQAAEDATVTVRLADLHRAIDTVAQRAA